MSAKCGPSREQTKLMKEFHDHSCFEFMGKDDVSADDPKGFVRLWHKNIAWLGDVVTETDHLATAYMTKHG